MPQAVERPPEGQNLPDNQSESTSKTKTDYVLRAIDAEISEMRLHVRDSGRTQWGLLAALAGSLWVAIEHGYAPSVNYDRVVQVILVFSVVLALIRFLRSLLRVSDEPSAQTPRFEFTTVLARTRLRLSLELASVTALSLLAHDVWSRTGETALLLLAICFGAYAVMAITVILLSFFRLPIAKSAPSRVFPCFLDTTCIILFGYCFWRLVTLVNSTSPPPPPAELRMAGAIVIAYCILTYLASWPQSQPLFGTLHRLRRELCLGRIDADSAAKEFDIAMAGLRLDEVFHPEIAKLLAKASAAKSGLRETVSDLHAAKGLLEKNDNPDEETRRAIPVLVNSAKAHFDSARVAVTECHTGIRAFRQRAERYRRFFRARFDDTGVLLKSFESEIGQMDKDTKELLELGRHLSPRIRTLEPGKEIPIEEMLSALSVKKPL